MLLLSQLGAPLTAGFYAKYSVLAAAIDANGVALALIACGLNSTVTATLAGQVVMEGFVRLRMKPALRRFVPRLMAIAPAVGLTLYAGESATGHLLVASQVVLSMALPFAVAPLIWFTASRRIMGEQVAPRFLTITAWVIAAMIMALNAKLLVDMIFG